MSDEISPDTGGPGLRGGLIPRSRLLEIEEACNRYDDGVGMFPGNELMAREVRQLVGAALAQDARPDGGEGAVQRADRLEGELRSLNIIARGLERERDHFQARLIEAEEATPLIAPPTQAEPAENSYPPQWEETLIGEPADPESCSYPDPMPADLERPDFEAVWQAIKGWDIQRENGAGYAGPTGNDVMHILAALATPAPRLATGEAESGREAALRDYLAAVLKRDALFGLSGMENDCRCIAYSRETEREYENGNCPHQKARAALNGDR